MKANSVLRRRVPVRLGIHPLEERANPATTFDYSGLSRTLTVTADQGDQLTVSQMPTLSVTGFIQVADGSNNVLFQSYNAQTHKAKIVRHLVFHFDGVNDGSLTVDKTVRLGGSIGVFGAAQTQAFTSNAVYGGSITYHGTQDAVDTVTLGANTKTGGKVDLELGGGNNAADIRGGYIGGSLTVKAFGGNDTVTVLHDADIRVNSSATIDLGDGSNTLEATATNTTDPTRLLDIAKDFKYQGGIDADAILLRDVDVNSASPHYSSLRVGGSAKFNLDTTKGATGANDVELGRVSVGGKLTFTGGDGNDTVQISGPILTGGDVVANLKEGANYFDSNVNGYDNRNRLGNSFIYTGGAGEDQVYLDGSTVAKDVNVTLGNWDGVNTLALDTYDSDANHQFFRCGTFNPNTIYGSFKVKSGPIVHNLQNPASGDAGGDRIRVDNTFIGRGVDIALGSGDDRVYFNDSAVSGTTKVDLGDGDDRLSIDVLGSDPHGDLTGATSFGGLSFFKGGLGDDTFEAGRAGVTDTNGAPASHVIFGDRVTFEGDDGDHDKLTLGDDVIFLTKGSKTTCEDGGVTNADLQPGP
jgi:hypothetical protein